MPGCPTDARAWALVLIASTHPRQDDYSDLPMRVLVATLDNPQGQPGTR